MRVNHRPHESQTGKGRKPSETLTPREIDLVRALDGLQRAGRQASFSELSAWLGVKLGTTRTICESAILRGGVVSTGFGATRKLTITEMGRAALGDADG